MKLDWSKDVGMQKIRGGRTVDKQIQTVMEEGNLVPHTVLRERLMAELGMVKKSEKAPNVFVFGCLFPFYRHALIKSCLDLFDRLAPEYTFLDKEYCCGGPMTELAPEADKKKAEEASREFMLKNLVNAQAVGAKNMVYYCVWCAYQGKKILGESGVRQMYYPDLILDRLEHERLALAPMTVGYYEGCHSRGHGLAPGIDMNWKAYRHVLDRIEGLKVVDLPNEICCVVAAPRVIDAAVKQGLQTIIASCPAGFSRLTKASEGRVKVRYWPQLVLKALGGSADI